MYNKGQNKGKFNRKPNHRGGGKFQQEDKPKSEDLIIGLKPVEEALNNKVGLEKVFMIKSVGHSELTILAGKLREANIPVSFVPKVKLDKLSSTLHQGVIALRSKVNYHSALELAKALKEEKEKVLLVALDRITDVRNVGAISRSAVCFGASGLIVPAQESAQINAEAIKSSAGALNAIPVCREKSLLITLEELQAMDFQIVVASEKSDVDIQDVVLGDRVVLVMGNEHSGVSDKIYKGADERVKISMKGDFDSLNVSVASGIALYTIGNKLL